MKRILLTGMSGSGKSTITRELAARGYKAVDADCDEFSEWVALDAEAPGTPVEAERDWLWRADRIQVLLDTENTEVLFLSGCAPNMREFLPRFDHVILLSASADIILERLASRTGNSYGKAPGEAARVLELIQTVEPLLRRAADHEINTSAPLDEVVAEVLRIAQQ